MRVGLHDAEKDHFKHKTFPNLALMKISAYHKIKGDSVDGGILYTGTTESIAVKCSILLLLIRICRRM